MAGAEVAGAHPDQEAAVDVCPVPGPAAHAVGHQPPLLRGGGHHLSAGTDAEGEGAAPVGQVAGQFVVGGRQALPGRAKLGLGEGGLCVLDPHADGKGLGGKRNARLQQQFEGIPGGVAGGEDQRVAGQVVGALGALRLQRGQLAVSDLQTGQAVSKAYVAAQLQQLQADGLHHVPEQIGADVGLVLPEDILRSARRRQRPEDGGNAGIVGTGGQLAVGKSARAPFPELYVGGRVQYPGLPKAFHVPCARFHRTAPLQYDGRQSVPGQEQRGEQPRRPHADHHRRQRGSAADRGKRVGLRLKQSHVGVARLSYQSCLLRGGHMHRAHIVDVVLLTGVDRLPGQREGLDLARRKAQQSGRPRSEQLLPAVDGQDDVLNSDHGVTSFLEQSETELVPARLRGGTAIRGPLKAQLPADGNH